MIPTTIRVLSLETKDELAKHGGGKTKKTGSMENYSHTEHTHTASMH